ncbi:MAG: hypothetical protein FJ308_00585 [Planctomycetes bacterium]|nr:hypothetical protein [Planctomycetota bacterium]
MGSLQTADYPFDHDFNGAEATVQWVQFAIRPTFTLDIPYPRHEAISSFASTLQQMNDETLYLSHGDYAEFHLEPHLHRLWSPHLSVYFLDDHAPNHSVLFGRFAPRPNVWTLVWIFYLLFFAPSFLPRSSAVRNG